jgi:peptidoglycan/LPS O-acetylase OafA/YrhL
MREATRPGTIMPLSSTSPERLPYAAALDGLRAIAVVAVVGYHLDISWMRGGFLGVDLFFVISGFLITRLLLGEHVQSGRIDFGAFWVRRFRRLVPPLVVVVAASVVATRLWGVPAQWAGMRGDVLASLGYVANWRFVLNDTSYFDTLLGPSPLRHIWSLAVEEQWYLVWPLVMAVLAPWAARRSRVGTVGVFLLVAAVASAAWMAFLYDPADLSRVYYGTDTRAQQLLVGAALAWITAAAPARFDGASLAGLRLPANGLFVGFVAATVFIDDEAAWLYRGGLLALSLGAAVLVVATSVPGSDGPLGWLAHPWMVALGRRSYSLYLWHWPVIVFVGPPMGIEGSDPALALLRTAVALALTEATYRLVETPIRHGSGRAVKVVAGWSAAAVITVAGASTTLATELTALPDIEVLRPTVIPPRAAPLPPPDTTAPSATVRGPTTAEDPPVPSPTTTLARPAFKRLLLLGDSTAFVLAEDREVDQPTGWTTIGYARLGCAITDGDTIDVGDDQPTLRFDDSTCHEWEFDWTDVSDQFRPTVSVVMVGAWEVLDHVVGGRRLSFPSPEWSDHVDGALRRGVAAASTGGGRVVLLRLPCMDQAAGSLISAQARNDPARIDEFNAIAERIAADTTQVSTLPLDDLLCPDGQPIGDIDGDQIRSDGVHLTPAGSDLVWAWLGEQLAPLV